MTIDEALSMISARDCAARLKQMLAPILQIYGEEINRGRNQMREKRKVEFIESYWTGGEYGSDYKWNDNHGELVRCADCKHRSKELHNYYGNPNDKVYVCQLNDLAKKPDWFCADGERRGDGD